MLDKFIFNEDINRVFNFITNKQIVCQYIFKDFISDIKILNEYKKKEKTFETNSKSICKYNDSSQNLLALNNIASKTNNTSVHPMAMNNSFLYLNSSFRSINLEKMEGSIIECKWKKKYILLLRIIKINDEQRFYKSIEIECLEMNHFESPFTIDISLYWNTSTLQTILFNKLITKHKLIEEITNRELNINDKKKLNKLLNDYLNNDLTNLENCATSLIFANAKEIAYYLSDITKIIKFSPGMENKRFEKYSSPLLNSAFNCRVYDIETNKLWQEYIFSGFYADKIRGCQIRWEKKENGKIYCIYRISITYLEENFSLLIFKNVFQTHVTTQYLSEININKKRLFKEITEYFNKKNKITKIAQFVPSNINNIKFNLAIKNYNDKENDEDKNDINMFSQNSFIKIEKKGDDVEEKSKFDSLMLTHSYIDNSNNNEKEGGKLFGESIQNISEIENINSILFGEEDNNQFK